MNEFLHTDTVEDDDREKAPAAESEERVRRNVFGEIGSRMLKNVRFSDLIERFPPRKSEEKQFSADYRAAFDEVSKLESRAGKEAMLAMDDSYRRGDRGDSRLRVEQEGINRDVPLFYRDREKMEKWLRLREDLLSTIVVPEQNPVIVDKHTKTLANALTSVIINRRDVSPDKMSRMSGILTSRRLPDFVKQMSICQIINPSDELDLEYKSIDGLRFSVWRESITLADGLGGKLESPVIKMLAIEQKRARLSGEDTNKASIRAEDGRQYTAADVIYHDILKCAFGSNGRSIKAFLDDLELCDNFIDEVRKLDNTKKVKDCFTEEQIREGVDLIETLNSLYYAQMEAGKNEDTFRPVDLPSLNEIMEGPVASLEEVINKIEKQFGVTSRYSLGNRIVRSFCYPLGITGIEDARDYLHKRHEEATERNTEAYNRGEIGKPTEDTLFKGVEDVNYLPSLLEDGILAKEYLGVGAIADQTPRDADFATSSNTKRGLRKAIRTSIASRFSGRRDQSGFIIATKMDNRFSHELGGKGYGSVIDRGVYDRGKYGYYEQDNYGLDEDTGGQAFGVRTGMASSDIDYIIAYNKSAKQVIDYVMKNDFYIPVVNFNGEVLLTPEMWKQGRR